MNLVSLLTKAKKLTLLLTRGEVAAKWKSVIWKEASVLKNWRAILNPKSVVLRKPQENVPLRNNELAIVIEKRFGGSPRLIRLISGTETKVKIRNGIKHNLLSHDIMIGKQNGELFTINDVPYRIIRPSLDDYVVLMKRIACPCYPKDMQAMLSIGDVRRGSRVLEAGTGSGALTLYLSNAVGSEGHIYSFDDNEKHQKRAKENIENWTSSWNQTKYPNWPENMTFYNDSVKECSHVVQSGVDTIFLDLKSPENYLEFLAPLLKLEGPIVIFLPSITQVVEVVSFCNENKLPYKVDKVVEVNHRFWKIQAVKPAVNRDEIEKDDEETDCAALEDLSNVKYTAKPSFEQLPHTGFILKLVHRIE